MNVARAFQPEICPRRLDCPEIAAAERFCGLLVSREDAKPRRKTQSCQRRARGTCPLTPDPSPPFHGGEGRIASVARAFQPEICPWRPDCLEFAAAGRGGRLLVSHEDAKRNANGRGDGGDVLSGSPYHFLESTLYGMDAMPPHPRPLSPVSRGRGED